MPSRSSISPLRSAGFATAILLAAACTSPSEPTRAAAFVLSSPAAEGMDANALKRLSAAITAGTYGETHSVVILRHDRLVFEEYYRGATREGLHPVYSATKSVIGLMVGVAVAAGQMGAIDTTPLLSFVDNAPTDSAHRAITVAHGLTMRAGLAWDELSVPYGDPANDVTRLQGTNDWLYYAASRDIERPAGAAFRYNSGLSLLLGRALQRSTGMDAEEWTRTHLFVPLGIDRWNWLRGPDEVLNSYGGLALRTRDLAKIGLLVLHGGTWNETPLVPRLWIERSTARAGDDSQGYGYGYQWWTHPLRNTSLVTPAPDDVGFAWGWGGQHIFVIPRFNLVVAITAGNFVTNGDEGVQLLLNGIVPAVVR